MEGASREERGGGLGYFIFTERYGYHVPFQRKNWGMFRISRGGLFGANCRDELMGQLESFEGNKKLHVILTQSILTGPNPGRLKYHCKTLIYP